MNVVGLSRSNIRLRSIALAIRIADPSAGQYSLLLIQEGLQWNLPFVMLEEKGTMLPLDALLHYVWLTVCEPHGLSRLHEEIAVILKHRNLSRFVGGGTYYTPYVTYNGYQAFDAYVVIDVLRNVLPTPLPNCLSLFHAKSSASMLATEHDAAEGKRLLLSLLRLRYQVRQPKVVKQ